MKIIGLTGAIASGKSFVAEIFRRFGAKIFDADHEVHQMFLHDQKVIAEIKNFFPLAYKNNIIDRSLLSEIIVQNKEKLKILEEIIHPQIRVNYQNFLSRAKHENEKLIVLNIPLLLEDDYYRCDKIVAIIADEEVRKKRYIARSISSNELLPTNNLNDSTFSVELNEKVKRIEEKFYFLNSKQLKDSERISRSDFIINNGSGIDIAEEVRSVIEKTFSS